MPVVKSGQSAPLIRSAVVLDMGDVEAQAQRIVAQAQAESREIIEVAERRAAHLAADAERTARERGFEQGLVEGRAQGMREGREQAHAEAKATLHELSQRWIAAIEEWESQRERMYDEAREDVLRFAFALAERVVHRVVRADPALVADQMRAAMALLSKPTMVQVSAHPDDRAILEQVIPEVIAAIGRSAHVRLHDDPTIERGGCVAATAGGYVDATLNTQLDRLAETLLRDGRLVLSPADQGSPAEPDNERA